MPHAAIYTRVSTDKQTTENQLPELRQLAAARGFEAVVWEETESAMKKRPVLDRLLAEVRAGRVHAICVWSLDRLGRGFACFDLFRELTRLGVRVLSVREPWTDVDGPARELLVAVMAWVSGFERERLIERTKAGLERARRSGKRLGRPPVSSILLGAAADLVARGSPVSEAARRKGVTRSTLRRFIERRTASGATNA
jgi:DNA invertase Pin-like site-specific DNA recombinase